MIVVMAGVGPDFTDGSAAGVAGSTGVHLKSCIGPAEINEKTVVGLLLYPTLSLFLGPLDVFLSRTMAGLASYIHLVPGGIVGAGLNVEVLPQVRCVAFCAH
jgi:hypothetical protein